MICPAMLCFGGWYAMCLPLAPLAPTHLVEMLDVEAVDEGLVVMVVPQHGYDGGGVEHQNQRRRYGKHRSGSRRPRPATTW